MVTGPLGSRLEWPKDHHFPPCALTFRDGWEPPSLTAPQEPSQLTEGRSQEEATAGLPEVSSSGSGSRCGSGSGSGPMFSPAHRNYGSSHEQLHEQDAAGADPER